MAVNENMQVISINTSADLTAAGDSYKMVTAAGAKTASATGADVLGIMQDQVDGSVNGPKPLNVAFSGVSKLRVDGNAVNIAVGNLLTSDANGKGVTNNGGALTSGDHAICEALEASTADNDIIKVLINSPRCGEVV